jgi:hypothetical protein
MCGIKFRLTVIRIFTLAGQQLVEEHCTLDILGQPFYPHLLLITHLLAIMELPISLIFHHVFSFITVVVLIALQSQVILVVSVQRVSTSQEHPVQIIRDMELSSDVSSRIAEHRMEL